MLKKIYNLISCLRIKHYIKNCLIFLPLFFHGSINDTKLLIKTLISFIIFSFASSIIYIINDINDIEKDKKHKYKKERPFASGKVKIFEGYVIIAILFVIVFLLLYYLNNINILYIILIYLIINIFYCFYAKNIPILDIFILICGYVLRVVCGSVSTGIEISDWLYLTVFSFSFFFALCKRRNELHFEFDNIKKNTREVLKYYNYSFLDKNMYIFLCMSNVFYALWSIDCNIKNAIWTTPLISIISLKYSLIIEGNSSGDPIEVIFNDKILVLLIFLYTIIMLLLIYF